MVAAASNLWVRPQVKPKQEVGEAIGYPFREDEGGQDWLGTWLNVQIIQYGIGVR